VVLSSYQSSALRRSFQAAGGGFNAVVDVFGVLPMLVEVVGIARLIRY
jgi:hypothetical protein